MQYVPDLNTNLFFSNFSENMNRNIFNIANGK